MKVSIPAHPAVTDSATMMTAPLFIVFEGIDGSGKSTQARLLADHLRSQGLRTALFSEPSSGEWGTRIRAMIGSETPPPPEEQHRLFLADREDDVSRNIAPALSSGVSVILDRYYYSNAAYQGAAGLDPSAVIRDNRNREFPEPDRVYLIDIAPDLAFRRIASRNGEDKRDCFERVPFLEKVRAAYFAVAGENFCIIDGSQSEEAVYSDILVDFKKSFRV